MTDNYVSCLCNYVSCLRMRIFMFVSCLFHDVSCLGSWACTLSNVSYCFMFGRNTIVGVGKWEPDLFVAMVSEIYPIVIATEQGTFQ